jgi:hypothetical protein
MAIRINTQIVHASIASVLREIDPSANIFDNPNQQGTPYPAWFIVHRSPVEIQKEIKRYVLVYQIDIWYMLKQNITRLYDQYSAIAEQLDDKLEYLPVFGGDGAVVHVYDRSWGLELNALKYSITLKFRCSRDTVPDEYMQVIQDLFVFLKMQNEAILSFQNTSHPEFDAQLPNPISVTKGRSVNLPFVGGEFEDDNYKWTPSGWTLGAFGALIQLNESMTADLLWRSEEKTASLSFTNTLHPEFDVELPDTIIANKGTVVVLPTVEGSFPEGIKVWKPSSWDIGAFGEEYILNDDTIANLLYAEAPSDIVTLWAKTTDPDQMYYQGNAKYSATPIISRLYELYTDEGLTQRFEIDPNKIYEKGSVVDNVWVPDEIQNISDMPYSVTTNYEASKRGILIYYNGSSNLWPVTNYYQDVWITAEGGKISFLFKVKNMPEVPYEKAYFTTKGNMEMSNETFGSTGYRLYDSNGARIPGNSSKTYTIVDMIKRDGTSSDSIGDCTIRIEYGYLSITGTRTGNVVAYCVLYTVS